MHEVFWIYLFSFGVLWLFGLSELYMNTTLASISYHLYKTIYNMHNILRSLKNSYSLIFFLDFILFFFF